MFWKIMNPCILYVFLGFVTLVRGELGIVDCMIESTKGERISFADEQVKKAGIESLQKGDCVDFELIPGTKLVSNISLAPNKCPNPTETNTTTPATPTLGSSRMTKKPTSSKPLAPELPATTPGTENPTTAPSFDESMTLDEKMSLLVKMISKRKDNNAKQDEKNKDKKDEKDKDKNDEMDKDKRDEKDKDKKDKKDKDKKDEKDKDKKDKSEEKDENDKKDKKDKKDKDEKDKDKKDKKDEKDKDKNDKKDEKDKDKNDKKDEKDKDKNDKKDEKDKDKKDKKDKDKKDKKDKDEKDKKDKSEEKDENGKIKKDR